MTLIKIIFFSCLGWKTNLNSVKDHLNTVAATQVDFCFRI